MVKDNVQARRRLDERFRRLRPLADEPRPHRGWIRAIRDALGMSSTELAARIGVSQQRVSQMEHSELQETITLETLRRAANALDCDLVYVLEPRTSLEEAVREQANKKAARHLAPLAHHSRLEDQALSNDDEAAQLEEFASRFIDRKGLWSEPDDPQ
ncbi:MAG: mobile mystery protein A [Actinomycetota bacterium]|nr:mobile mystery protein A [Actinomycetota bacterium]MDK1104315.1 mobile mystery protein A [Actinomycetota bacterium]